MLTLRLPHGGSNLSDVPLHLICNYWSSPSCYSRQENRLPLHPTINALNDYKTSLYFPILLKTTNTSRFLLVHALVDSRATGVFINQIFVKKHGLNICRLSKSIPIYNVNGTPNETGQITKVVDLVFQYKTHLEQTLFAVSSLSRQDLILRFTQLKIILRLIGSGKKLP